jgi:hypothetical protein
MPTRHANTWCPNTVSTPTSDGSPRSAGHAGGCAAVAMPVQGLTKPPPSASTLPAR